MRRARRGRQVARAALEGGVAQEREGDRFLAVAGDLELFVGADGTGTRHVGR